MKGQILLIDDNPVDLKIVSTALEKSGYACYGFTEHQKAMDWKEQHTPQIIMLDLQMPHISGFDLIPHLRSHVRTASVPIIIISGKNQVDDIKKAIQLGANDYIIKPLDPLVLQEKVQRIDLNSPQEFHSVDISASAEAQAFFARPLRILSISEFGLRVLSSFQIRPNETIEVNGIATQLLGSDKLILRCLSLEKAPNQEEYIMQFTYVGMKESQRQFIRQSCRKIWVQSKKGIA